MHLNDLLIIVVVIAVVLIVGAAQRRFKRLRGLSSGLLVSLVTTCLLAGAAETYFRGYADSGYPFTETLASINWMQRYFSINSDGFRDREWTDAELSSRRVIYCLGDSFAEGWGIDNPEDRYSNVLGSLLGDEYAVLNLGRINTATDTQLSLLQDEMAAHPDIHPETIIWQYYLNDIEFAGFNIVGLYRAEFPPRPPLADESYLANFLYWQYARRNVITPNGVGYWQFMYNAYDNSAVWAVHQQEIDALVEYVESIGARLIVVIFPNPSDPVGSVAYVDRVAQAVEAHGETDILKLYDIVAGTPIEQIVVSSLDSHPSVWFNHYVGQRLYQDFFQQP
ncbi:MAG: SGNH/GDSL hydrolase family protein [Anaerolineae bacterium]